MKARTLLLTSVPEGVAGFVDAIDMSRVEEVRLAARERGSPAIT
ncbi:MAG TPA: hypothetical protein VKF83_07765 [Stellaceae bacterium]|nr:hypothetical protein [Stellaceae bacterium]